MLLLSQHIAWNDCAPVAAASRLCQSRTEFQNWFDRTQTATGLSAFFFQGLQASQNLNLLEQILNFGVASEKKHTPSSSSKLITSFRSSFGHKVDIFCRARNRVVLTFGLK
jgi:hypothetical protein